MLRRYLVFLILIDVILGWRDHNLDWVDVSNAHMLLVFKHFWLVFSVIG